MSRVQEKKDTANEKCQQAINLNITNSNNIIMSGMVSKMQDKERGEAARKKKQTTNINIANNIIKILLHVVSRVQDKNKGRWLTKNNQYQHCPPYHEHHVTCGVKSAR